MDNKEGPRNIAIILDGNRRYAKKKGLKPWQGHKYGADKVKDLLEWCRELGIEELTLYTFSKDNFDRTEEEKKALFRLFDEGIKKIKNDKRLVENKIRVRFIGRLQMFPEGVRKHMNELMENTKEFDKFKLNFAMAYSGKAEIVDSLKKIIGKIKNNEINEDDVDEDLVNENLYYDGRPDILIRPGGEKRISDFLIWQAAYTELIFLDKLWPEFTKEDLLECIEEFKNRERRFGK